MLYNSGSRARPKKTPAEETGGDRSYPRQHCDTRVSSYHAKAGTSCFHFSHMSLKQWAYNAAKR